MSDQEQKDKRSKRLHDEETAIKKQLKIAKQHQVPGTKNTLDTESHRLAKHHAMDCGNPECGTCGNPRHIYKNGETKQEKSFEQTKDWD
jgi:hypothetical protein